MVCQLTQSPEPQIGSVFLAILCYAAKSSRCLSPCFPFALFHQALHWAAQNQKRARVCLLIKYTSLLYLITWRWYSCFSTASRNACWQTSQTQMFLSYYRLTFPSTFSLYLPATQTPPILSVSDSSNDTLNFANFLTRTAHNQPKNTERLKKTKLEKCAITAIPCSNVITWLLQKSMGHLPVHGVFTAFPPPLYHSSTFQSRSSVWRSVLVIPRALLLGIQVLAANPGLLSRIEAAFIISIYTRSLLVKSRTLVDST